MSYDDEYWLPGYVEPKKQPIAPRSLQEACEVVARSRSTPRGEKVSPLLEDWLKKKGLAVK